MHHATRALASSFLIAVAANATGQGNIPNLPKTSQKIWETKVNLSPEELASIEAAYFEALNGTATVCSDLTYLRSVLLYAGSRGFQSNFFPSMLDATQHGCDPIDGFDALFAGSTFFNQGNYSEAVRHFERASALIPPSHAAHSTAMFNAAAALNASGQTLDALHTLDALLAEESHSISQHVIRTNMAAMQTSIGQYAAAMATLGAIDRSALNDYWNGLVDWNWFLARYRLRNFEESDSIWSVQLRQTPPENIPDGMVDEVLSTLLATHDFAYFSNLRNWVQREGVEAVLAENDEFSSLFAASDNLDEVMAAWHRFEQWEAERRTFIAKQDAAMGGKEQELIASLEHQLEQKAADAEEWRNYLLVSMLALLTGMLTWGLVRYRKQQRRLEAFEVLMEEAQGTPNPATAQAPRLEEIRMVGEAISFGKRTSDAMLVLRKWASDAEESRSVDSGDDLAQIPNIQTLNDREREVAELIYRGFDAKEIARLTSMSNAYTYNVRSRIRAKLDIPAEEDMLKWMKRHAHTA